MAKTTWHRRVKRAPVELRTDVDGTVFDSKTEFQRWKKLQLWQLAGEIRSLRRQVAYELALPDGTPILTPSGDTAVYTPDFVYEQRDRTRGWVEVIEEVKGFMDRGSAFRIAVFEALHRKRVKIVKRS